MRVAIVRAFTFEAAHRLPHVPPEHKCARLHGHSYRCEVTIEGPIDAHLGWLMDFADISALTDPIRLQLDHYYLNEIAGLENPTAEVIAQWIWDRLKPGLPQLTCVTIAETCTARVEYRGD